MVEDEHVPDVKKACSTQSTNPGPSKDGSGFRDPPAKTARIRELNDLLRATGQGGQVVITAGVAELPQEDQAAIFAAVRAYDDFDADNDPHGEHDFALVVLPGPCAVFKIDYYDLKRRAHSPDPADPAVTCRVLTIMLAEDC